MYTLYVNCCIKPVGFMLRYSSQEKILNLGITYRIRQRLLIAKGISLQEMIHEADP